MSNLIARMASYAKNMGIRRGLGLAAHRYLSKLLNPDAAFSWGSLGEDILLWWYLTEVLEIRKPGNYVDVGCNDPINHSNTWRLYQLGWSGLCIDADKTVIKRFGRVRPRDKAICQLVSDVEQTMDFHVLEGSLVSSVDRDHIAVWGKRNRTVDIRQLHARTLDSILEEHDVPYSFELLKIDVEGHDAAVLRSIDLNRYKPLIILIEIHGETVESIQDNEIYKRLMSFGYSMVSLAGYNGIFIRKEVTQ